MFVGHLGVAMAAKVVEPRVSLGVLVAAAYGVDLLWPIFLLAGVESVSVAPGATAFTPLAFEAYPWTHSLAMSLIWGGVAGGMLYVLGRGRRVATLVGAVVVSHWVLDAVVHAPDLPLWPRGPEVGLGLWHSVAGTLAVEGLLFAGALFFYLRAFPVTERGSRAGLAALVGVVVLIWLSGPFAPPPPGEEAVAVAGLALWILPFWAWRVEARRAGRSPGPASAGDTAGADRESPGKELEPGG